MAELIVALDVQTRAEAVEKVKLIGDAVGFYKIGLELYTAEGPDVVKAVKDLGKKVFLDLKFHDIPRTVERAVRSGGKLGVDLMTIHSVGGKAMISAAHEAAAEFALRCAAAGTRTRYGKHHATPQFTPFTRTSGLRHHFGSLAHIGNAAAFSTDTFMRIASPNG